jgi:hypothetical protein
MSNKKFVVTLLIVLCALGAVSGQVDSLSKNYIENALKNALVTIVIARTLNGVISVAQGTEVALEPGGIGVSFSVGEILDPINDMVERFSSVMLFAASSFGLQALVLNITAWWGVSLLLVMVSAAYLATLWMPGPSSARYATPSLHLLLAILFLRFYVPVLVIASNAITDMFLDEQRIEATAVLEATTAGIDEINQDAQSSPAGDQSIIDRVGSFFDSSLQALRVDERLSALQAQASNASEHIISLIAIFVLQTIVLPLLFLWLFAKFLKALIFRSRYFKE